MNMQVGESHSVSVAAHTRWNDTGIELSKGQTYHLKADGEWYDWKYNSKSCGYESRKIWLRLTEWLRRYRSANWFALIGAVGMHRESYFVIGSGCEYQAERDGRLLCFANDLWLFYFNNSGCIELTVTRTA
jgi:hypothetical protein